MQAIKETDTEVQKLKRINKKEQSKLLSNFYGIFD
jgi:hypothetical protein